MYIAFKLNKIKL